MTTPDARHPVGGNIQPYGDLHIYYIEGRLKREADISGPHFLGTWEEGGDSFLFFSEPADSRIKRLVERSPHLTLVDKYHMTYEQWQGGRVSAFSAGRFFIVPPWEKRDGAHGKIPLVLDPGVVFGTGTHPTTRDCLEALETVFTTASITSALDLGTGTGLLALAAARLGCRRLLAVDLNYLAARTALRNVRLNGLEHRICVAQGRAEEWVWHPADLLIANIHHDVMTHLLDSGEVTHNRWFILSGLLRSQAREVSDRLSELGATIRKTWETDGIWHTFLGKSG